MLKPLKRWPVLLALLVAVGALAVALVYLPFGSRVTRANCERIKQGMTEGEVRAILGKPWDNSLLDPEWPGRVAFPALISGESEELWLGSGFLVFVLFDAQGHVVFVHLTTDPDPPRSWLPGRVWRRLRKRYGW